MIRFKIKPKKQYIFTNENSASIGISLGQNAYEGEKLNSALNWAAKHFSKIHILLADTLHRHDMTFQFCESLADATVRANLEGSNWLMRNSDILHSIPVAWTLSRWQDWTSDARYLACIQEIRSLHNNNESFFNAVNKDAERFINRYIKDGNQVCDLEFAKGKCIEFVLEENAVFPLIIEDHGPVYLGLGSELDSTRIIREDRIPNAPRQLYERKHARLMLSELSAETETLQSAANE